MKFTNVFVGTVGQEPRSGAFDDGRPWANVRIAVNHDYFNGATGEVVSRGVSWFDVNAYGALAKNMAYCVHKGDSIIVAGELRLRDWEKDGRTGTSGTIVADVVGPNLLFGVAKFVSSSTLNAEPLPDGGEGEGDGPVPPPVGAGDEPPTAALADAAPQDKEEREPAGAPF
ncbi:MAG: single-stranded DNA-binding protein [Brevibacterium yomogidense]|uniref:Single-stranded DNA-binding protein n=1 Tax=Brevibacterium yomogidense TaxID=946573 RepID=A0A1X6XAW0_9MICO|nr:MULTISPECIES: single-stranded DNA-binding protein [Brevibacterium]SLM96243.1 Single-stranded DNA-binding protein [Brevibacterium yomogidense]SMX85362.1 single-strand DNA-binding protein [Brevibacterium sp. Mu109]